MAAKNDVISELTNIWFGLIKQIATWVILLIVFGCSSSSELTIDSNTSYDELYDFSSLSTFTVATGEFRTVEPPGPSPQFLKRLTSAIEVNMQEKGYMQEPINSADFILIVHGVTEAKAKLNDPEIYYGDYAVEQYTEGTLVVDVADLSTKKTFWRSTGKGVVGENSLTEQEVNQVVKELLAEFPLKNR